MQADEPEEPVNLPASQGGQYDAPCPEYLPESHCMQADKPEEPVNLPASQGEQTLLPVVLDVRAGQGLHSKA